MKSFLLLILTICLLFSDLLGLAENQPSPFVILHQPQGKRILSEEAIQLLSTKSNSKSPVAFGWRVNSEYNPSLLSDRTLSHTGFTGGSIWIDMDQRKFVIVLTNRIGDHDKCEDARIKLAEILLGEMR